MESIIKEISKLRNGRPLQIDRNNSNRYRIVTGEYDGSKTSYCFSVPIYNKRNGKLADFSFKHNGGISYVSGSTAEISVSDYIMLDTGNNFCRISIPKRTDYNSNVIRCEDTEISPTLNGVVIKADCTRKKNYKFNLRVGQPFMNARKNDKYFSLMTEDFKPFVTVSAVGTVGAGNQIISPAVIREEVVGDREYIIEVISSSPAGRYILFEVNMYEPKLFQDTTVESANPHINNAFGGTAFLGHTSLFGEQWLYTRPDFSRIPELMGRRVKKTVLHIPQLNSNNSLLSAYRIPNRFCSIGSNWDNKVTSGPLAATSEISNGYQSIDVSDLITEGNSKCITVTDGLILKSNTKNKSFSAISTGDSYFAPQILEVNV